MLEQILSKFGIKIEHKINTNLTRLHNLLRKDLNPIHIAILILTIEQQIAIEAREIVFVKVATFPGLLCNDLFGFVVDVEDWGFQGFAGFVVECAEHACVAEVVLVQVQVCVLVQSEFCGADAVVIGVVHEVVVYFLGLGCVVGQTRDADQHELPRGHLPHGRNRNLRLRVIRQKLPYIIRKLINLILPLDPVPKIKTPKLKPIIMPPLKPTNHRMIIRLPDHILIGPYLIIVELFERLLVLAQGVVEIAQLEGVVVVAAVLLDADCLGLLEDQDLALVGFGGFEVEEDVCCCVGFQVPYQDVVLSGLEDHHFSLAQHCKRIDIIREGLLLNNFTCLGIHMGEAILPMADNSQENDSVVAGGGHVQDLLILLLKGHLLVVNKQHDWIYYKIAQFAINISLQSRPFQEVILIASLFLLLICFPGTINY